MNLSVLQADRPVSYHSAITVRPAIVEDLDWLIEQLKSFSRFFGSKIPLYKSEHFAREAMTKMMTDHMVFVAWKEGIGPVGFIAGFVIPHIFNPTIRVLNETFWWVPEEHRGTRAGYLLLKAFIDFGKEHADWILFTLEDNSPVNEVALLNRGFKLKEKSFLMEVV